MTTTLYFKRLLSISLLSLSLLLAVGLAFAQTPQPVSKDNIRLANYVKVINSYIAEVKGAIASADPARQEYIAELLLAPEKWLKPGDPHYTEPTQAKPEYIGDYLSLSEGKTSSAYGSFKSSLEKLIAEFEAKHKAERLAASGELVYDALDKSNILKYRLMVLISM
ncbi:MAG: hypothetical protein WC628_04590 [Candidatus Omnitrophota bacterium]